MRMTGEGGGVAAPGKGCQRGLCGNASPEHLSAYKARDANCLTYPDDFRGRVGNPARPRLHKETYANT